MKNVFTKIADNTLESEIIWLAITAILPSTSSAGTAQWQYVLPRKTKKKIQGAILPLFEKYKKVNPFIGVILAGEFTESSITQLKSLGFSILHFSYGNIIKATYHNQNDILNFLSSYI